MTCFIEFIDRSVHVTGGALCAFVPCTLLAPQDLARCCAAISLPIETFHPGRDGESS